MLGPSGYGPEMTRDDAIRTAIFTLARWHRSDHGDRCVCIQADQFGAQAAALVDAWRLAVSGSIVTLEPIGGRENLQKRPKPEGKFGWRRVSSSLPRNRRPDPACRPFKFSAPLTT
jgi:hypothetical protein